MSTIVLAAGAALLAVAAGWLLERQQLPPRQPRTTPDTAVASSSPPAGDAIIPYLERTVREADSDTPVSVALFQLEGYEPFYEQSPRAARHYLEETLQAVSATLEDRQRLGTLEEPGGRLLAILPDTTSAGASIFAERARINVDPIVPEEGTPCPLSAGVVALSDPAMEPTELLEKAERALAQALKLGGDRVIVLRQDAFLEGPVRGTSFPPG